ncbi:hypothetical protein ACROYT_G003342 [Oculina patagonica]
MKTIWFLLLLTALMLDAAPGRDHQKGEEEKQKRMFSCGDFYQNDKCIDDECPDNIGIGECEKHMAKNAVP